MVNWAFPTRGRATLSLLQPEGLKNPVYTAVLVGQILFFLFILALYVTEVF